MKRKHFKAREWSHFLILFFTFPCLSLNYKRRTRASNFNPLQRIWLRATDCWQRTIEGELCASVKEGLGIKCVAMRRDCQKASFPRISQFLSWYIARCHKREKRRLHKNEHCNATGLQTYLPAFLPCCWYINSYVFATSKISFVVVSLSLSCKSILQPLVDI